MKKIRIQAFIVVGWILLAIVACGGGGLENGAEGGTGTLSLSLTDAATDQYGAIYITVKEIQVHLGGNENSSGAWRSVDMPASPMTLNLLQLVNGVREELGLANLPSGRYTQMRLILGRSPDTTLNIQSKDHPHANYLIVQGNPADIHELKIPSGFNNGVKIVNGFDIQANQTTELVLDFDACRSVVEAGNSGNWHLKPTIKVAALHEYVIIQGTVTDGANGLEGALVSVQSYDGSAVDAKDRVTVLSATITDEFGDYSLFVAPGTYQLVAYKNGRQPSVSRVATTTSQLLDNSETHFALPPASTGRVSGLTRLTNAGAEQYATLGFQQAALVDGNTVQIEIGSVNIMSDAAFDMGLPAGSYTLVASSFGYATATYPVIVVGNGAIRQDVTLNQ